MAAFTVLRLLHQHCLKVSREFLHKSHLILLLNHIDFADVETLQTNNF